MICAVFFLFRAKITRLELNSNNMIYKSVLISFMMLAGGLFALDTENDSPLVVNTKSVKKICPHIGPCPDNGTCQLKVKKSISRKHRGKKYPSLKDEDLICLPCDYPKKQQVVGLGRNPIVDPVEISKPADVVTQSNGQFADGEVNKSGFDLRGSQSTPTILLSAAVTPNEEIPIQKGSKVEPNNKKDIEKSDASDVKELEASFFERQEPTVQGSFAQDSKEKLVDEGTEITGAGSVEQLEISAIQPEVPDVQSGYVQDLNEKLVDEDTEIAGAGNVEKLEISDIQPEVSDVQSGYVQDLKTDHHKSVEEDRVTNVEDNEDSVFHMEESVTFPKFLKVKKSYKSAEEDKASDSESDLEIVEEEDEDEAEAEASDAANSQTLMSVLKKKRLKKITKRSYGQKPQKTSTRSEILKFVQISHTG